MGQKTPAEGPPKMNLRAFSLVAVGLLWGIASPLDRTRADDWVTQLIASNQPARGGLSEGTQLSLSDDQEAPTIASSAFSEEVVKLQFSDSRHPETEVEVIEYPNCVSHDPGKPGKPLFLRPGDINTKNSPSKRYCMPNGERAGHPHEVAWWADCSINKNYSAAFVGGGTPWLLAHKTRSRVHDEGTWGLDYDGIFKPRRVWLRWSCDREQGGIGSYSTDGAPSIFERLSHGK